MAYEGAANLYRASEIAATVLQCDNGAMPEPA